MTRAIAALALVAAVLAGVLGWLLYREHGKLTVAKVTIEQLRAEVVEQQSLVAAAHAAAKARSKAQARLDAQRIKDTHELSNALATAPDWAAGPVPGDVAHALGVQHGAEDQALPVP